jgi:hypothetical protein
MLWPLAVFGFFLGGSGAAAEGCYAKFRVPMDKLVGVISQSCRAFEKDEPSNCQRAGGERCQKAYDEVKRLRNEVCSDLAGDAEFIKSRQHAEGVKTQKDAQDASSALGGDTAGVSEALSAKLRGESAKINALIKENDSMIKAEYCAKNASLPTLASRMNAVNDTLAATRDLLDGLGKQKKLMAAQASSISTVSDQRSQSMSSLTSSLEDDADEGGTPEWVVPALAAGGAAAALYAILKSKDKGAPNPDVDLEPEQASKPAPGGTSPTKPTDKPPVFQGDPGKVFDAHGVRVDPAFSDSAKKQIASAVNFFPECQRKYLAGTVVRSNPRLTWRSTAMAGKCLPGRNSSSSPPTIELNETCRTGMGTHSALVVHELMHVLANRRGYYSRYRKAFNANARCGVSRYSHQLYGGENLNEDFAEAGRIAVFPASGQAYGGACVSNRLKAAREIINSCR